MKIQLWAGITFLVSVTMLVLVARYTMSLEAKTQDTSPIFVEPASSPLVQPTPLATQPAPRPSPEPSATWEPSGTLPNLSKEVAHVAINQWGAADPMLPLVPTPEPNAHP